MRDLRAQSRPHAASGSEELTATAQSYFRKHEHAARIGIISLPTNYTIGSETGIETQDALLAG